MSEWTIVADAGEAAGLGHLARSSALAGALRERGLEVNTRGLGVASPATVGGVEWLPLERLESLSPGAVLLDSYTASADAAAYLAEHGTLAVLLDGGTPPEGAALVVDVGAAGDSDDRRLRGLRFACLRPEFQGLPEPRTAEEVGSVLVTTGGGDREERGTDFARAAAEALPGAHVRLLRGPYARKAGPAGAEVVSSPASTAELLRSADLVITAAGQTLLEAAACGTPALVVPSAENQLGNAARVREAGAAALLSASAQGFPQALVELAADAGLRRLMSARGRAAVDGRGAHRVAERLAAL